MFYLSYFNKRKSLIGLDIHASEIRLLQLKKVKQRFAVEKFDILELPHGAIKDGKINNATLIRERMGQILRILDVQNDEAAIALPANSVITKRIKLSTSLSDEEQEAEIAANLKHYFPGMIDDVCFDFAPVGMRDDEFYDVLVAVARREQLNDYVDVVEQAGLAVKVVDMDSLALARSIGFAYPTKKPVAVLDLSMSAGQVFVIQNHEIIFYQQFVFTHSEIFIQNLIKELKRIFQLYLSIQREVQFEYLILSGSIYSSDLAVHLEKEFSFKTGYANPFLNVVFSSGIDQEKLTRHASRMLVSFGLALRGLSV